MDPRTVARELVLSARDLEAGPGFPAAYVERARAAAGALAPFELSDDEVDGAARLLGVQAEADPAVPVVATWRPRPVGQRLVKRLIDWYLSFLSGRVGEMGQAAARFGSAVTGRLDRIEGRQVTGRDTLRTEVARLEARVTELEDRLGSGRPGGPSGSLPSR